MPAYLPEVTDLASRRRVPVPRDVAFARRPNPTGAAVPPPAEPDLRMFPPGWAREAAGPVLLILAGVLFGAVLMWMLS